MSTGPGAASHARRPVVAVDGPSGSGKSTVSRRLAVALGVRYLDTGSMYRAVTWAVLRAGVDPNAADKVAALAAGCTLMVGIDPEQPRIWVDGEAVDAAIREDDVTRAVSAVSAVPAVRKQLVAQQRDIIAGATDGIVVEGRDIGAVVAPEAMLKVYLTASSQARALRRSSERSADSTGGVSATDLAATAADLARRDHLDSTRAADPLMQASDAVVVDSTELDIDEVVRQLVSLLRERQRA